MESDDAYVFNSEGNLVKLKDEFKEHEKNLPKIEFRKDSEKIEKKPCSCMTNKIKEDSDAS